MAGRIIGRDNSTRVPRSRCVGLIVSPTFTCRMQPACYNEYTIWLIRYMKKKSLGNGKQKKVKKEEKRLSKSTASHSIPESPKRDGQSKKGLVLSYYQPEISVAAFKLRLTQHLEMLRMPVMLPQHGKDCARDCHIIERNHTLESIKEFIQNIDSMS